MMRWLLGLVLVLGGLWCGYWFIGARGFEAATTAWIAQLEANGTSVRHDGLSVQGFPNRFDLTVTAPRVADPAKGIAWEAPFFQVLSLSYKPWHVIAAFPKEQRLTLPQGSVILQADKLQASVVAQPVPALPLDRLTLIGDKLVALGEGWTLRAEALRFATRRVEAGQNAHELALTITDLSPDAGLMALFDGVLPPQVALIRLDAVTEFTAPIDRMALQTHPQLAAMSISEARVDWGDIGVSATGRVTPDAAGFADGKVTIRLENWRLALDVAQSIGVIGQSNRKVWDQAAAFLALGSSDKDAIELPVQFRDGIAMVGPFPVGAAPRLR